MGIIDVKEHPLATCRAGRRAAFTLVELLMGLVVLSMVAVAVACMLNAVAYGTDASRDMRTLVSKQDVIQTRLNDAIRSAHAVLAAEPGTLVLWMRDTDGNGKPNANELERIDTQNNQLDGWTPVAHASTQSYSLDSDFVQITSSLEQSGDLAAQKWATGVQDFSPAVSTTSPQEASLVSWRVTLTDGVMSQVVAQCTSLRNKEAP